MLFEIRNRLFKTIKLFISLRLFEFLFSLSIIFILSYLFDKRIFEFNYIISVFRMAAGFCIIYMFTFLYIPFSFIVFLISFSIIKIERRNISIVNSLAYVVHSSPLMLIFGREPFQPKLWLAWLAIIIFNALIPRLLGNSLFPKARCEVSRGLR